MHFWYLTSTRIPDDQVANGDEGEAETKRMLTANYEWVYPSQVNKFWSIFMWLCSDFFFLQVPKGVYSGSASRLDHHKDRALQTLGLSCFWCEAAVPVETTQSHKSPSYLFSGDWIQKNNTRGKNNTGLLTGKTKESTVTNRSSFTKSHKLNRVCSLSVFLMGFFYLISPKQNNNPNCFSKNL